MGLFSFGKKEVKKAEVKKVDVKGAYVKVLGSGCCKCNDMSGSVMEALELLGKEASSAFFSCFPRWRRRFSTI